MSSKNSGFHLEFMEDYINELLEANNVNLTDDQKQVYVPQIMIQAEQRIGLELLPKLSEEHLDEFNMLMEKDGTSDEEWRIFWNKARPHIEDDVKEILTRFAEEVRGVLNV